MPLSAHPFRVIFFLSVWTIWFLVVTPVNSRWGRSTETKTSVALEPGFEYVTYASVVKLEHPITGFRLHSQEVAYGTGSRQQTVTALERNQDDDRGFWLVKAPQQALQGFVAQPKGIRRVRCGDWIRLEHLATRTHLHSHQMVSPLSGQQEVSAFALDALGAGDSGDHWQVECVSNSAMFWKRNDSIYLRHVDTATMYLAVLVDHRYHDPLDGHAEVVCLERKSARQPELRAQWIASDGFFHASAAG
jgi:dolichyl-phosphate-mannose--protein O-mannosyl transferase